MNLKQVPKAFAATMAIAAPFLVAAPDALLAKQPGIQPDCAVGTAAYPTIQSAVDDPECSTIGVPAGTFRENVIINRALTIRGAGAHRTTVDGSSALGSVFRVVGAYASPCSEPGVAVTFEGMTITGGTGPECPSGTPNCNGGGIGASPGAALTVKNCIVSGNSTSHSGGGISVPNGKLTVMSSVISGNTAFANAPTPSPIFGGGGLRVAGCPSVLVVLDTVVKDNLSYAVGGGILSYVATAAQPPGTLIVSDSDIKHNTATAANGGGGIYYVRTTMSLSSTKVKGNHPDDVRQGPNP